MEHAVQNHENCENRNGQNEQQPALRSFLTLVLSGPIEAISGRQLHLLIYRAHCLFHRAAKVAPAHTVFQCHIPGISLAIDFRSAISNLHFRKLVQSDSFTGGRGQTDIFDGIFRLAVRGLISHNEVVALLPLQHLADSFTAHGRFDGVLYIGDIDLIARRLPAINGQVKIRLSDHAEQTQVFDAWDFLHDADDLLSFLFESSQIVAIDFHRQFAFYAADSLLHIVRNRLGKSPKHAGNFTDLAVHGPDQFILVLVKHRTPLLLRLQVHEIFRIEKTRGIGTVVGSADLRNHLSHFGKRSKNLARLVCYPDALGGSSAGGQCPTGPDGAFVQVWQKFRTDYATKGEE